MSPARSPSRKHWGWNTRSEEVERLEKELAESRAREHRARREVEETRERFERLLDASGRNARSLSGGRQQNRTIGRFLRAEHAVDRVLAGADSLEDAAADVLRTLGENLGWQAALLWAAGEERLRCLAVCHRPNAVPDGFARARLQTNLVRGVRWIHLKGRVHTNEAGESTRVRGIMLDITEMKQAEQGNERLRSLEASVHAEAAERDRISRDLHDRVAHSMGVAYQSLQLYEALAKKDPARAESRLRTAKEMTKTALEQTRNLSMELRRSETENGLDPTLRDLLEVAVPDDVSAEFSASGGEARLSDHQRGQLYLILREAVRNAVKHSDCHRITVGLDVTPEEATGYVEDDRRGFGGNGEGGLGLRSIKVRAAPLEGGTEVYSSPEGGAGVRVRLPLLNGGG